jgi:hypothetical protein
VATRTAGSASGLEKRPSGNVGTALQADSAKLRRVCRGRVVGEPQPGGVVLAVSAYRWRVGAGLLEPTRR